jgi:hypothetical protein
MEHPPGIVLVIVAALSLLLIFGAGTMVVVWMTRPDESASRPWTNLVMGVVAVGTVIAAAALATISAGTLVFGH